MRNCANLSATVLLTALLGHSSAGSGLLAQGIPDPGKSEPRSPSLDERARQAALNKLLVRRVPASWRRAYLDEVMRDLRERAGLLAAYKANLLDGKFTFTLEKSAATVRKILDGVARAGNLRHEFHVYPDGAVTVVFWKSADEREIEHFLKKATSPKPEERRHAVSRDLVHWEERRPAFGPDPTRGTTK